MITPTAQSSSHFPERPSSQVLLSWMERSELAVYKEQMQSALDTHAIVPEEIRSVTAKYLFEELTLPSFGVALQFIWAVYMSDASEDWTRMDEVRTSIVRLDELEVSKWLESENLNNLALLFLTNSITGKRVEVLQATDMMDVGLSDSKEIHGFFKARTKLMGTTEPAPYSKAMSSKPPSTMLDPPELSSATDEAREESFTTLPVTPEILKRMIDAPSPPTSAWKRLRKASPMTAMIGTTAAGTSTKQDAELNPFSTVMTCEKIWDEDLSSKTVQILMMHCQGDMYKNVKWNRWELVFYGITKAGAWVKILATDVVAERFFHFKEKNLSREDSSYLIFSSVSHGRGRGQSGDSNSEDGSMQFEMTPHCRFKQFEPCDTWSAVSPSICEDFSDLSAAATGARVFIYARIHEFDDIITSPHCSARRLVQLMDKYGNKRQLTAWEPLHAFSWRIDKVITLLGARIERSKYHGFVINSDACIVENDDDDVSSFRQKVNSRSWDTTPMLAPTLGSPFQYDFRGGQ